jgi:hypothetical protein
MNFHVPQLQCISIFYLCASPVRESSQLLDCATPDRFESNQRNNLVDPIALYHPQHLRFLQQFDGGELPSKL